MMPLSLAGKCLLVALVLLAAWFDVKHRRIPNWLVAAGAALGVLLEWKPGLFGMALALAAQVPFFALRMIGGGDVKLMAAVGAIAGPMNWLFIFAVSSVVEGFAALVQVKRKRKRLPRAPFVAVAALLLLAAS